MPNRWFHEAIDLISWGRSYWPLHKAKDAASATMGPKHRSVGHEWYQCFGRDWSYADPFPDALRADIERVRIERGGDVAEEQQAAHVHDYFDRIWDELSSAERLAVAEAIRQVILDPRRLSEWAGVDVVRGLVKRVYSPEDGYLFQVEIWEEEPSLRSDYGRLRAFIEDKAIGELV